MPSPSECLNRAAVIIITGGSSGIGCSIIKAIQNIGVGAVICNLSRSKPGVFLGENGVHISTDLSDACAIESAANKLQALIAEAEPGEVLLINNSGFGDYGVISGLDRRKHLNMIDLNIKAMVDLTMRLLPQMIDRGGAVVNIASTAAFQPTPFLATYGATKSFVLNWTLALGEDLSETSVRTLAVCPGPTRSNFFKSAGFDTPPMNSGANATLDMTSDQVAEYTLDALAKGKAMVVTGWKNQCIAFFGSKMPIVAVTRIGARILLKLRLEQHKKEK